MAENSRLCPVCARPLEGQAKRAACLRCQNLYHPECWEGLTRCLAFGCVGTPEEALQDLEEPVPAKPCPACNFENPASAAVCLSCGADLFDKPARALFTSFAGWQAATPEVLVLELDRHWENAVQHLYNGDLEAWFSERGRQDLAEAARTARRTHEQHSVGLESFLLASSLVDPPRMEVAPATLELEGPGPTLTSALEVRNLGRGYLSGSLLTEVPWLTLEPAEFAGNRTRIAVTADLTRIPDGSVPGVIRIQTPAQCLEVQVTARRLSIAGVLELYREGQTSKARTLCRKLIDAQAAHADAAVLLAACYLKEENPTAAVQALRNLSGACQELPSDLVEVVFRWLGQNDPAASGVERVEVYEALIPCAEGPLADELRRTLGQVAMERARLAAEAFRDNNTSLWQGRTATTQDVIELLQIAAAYDPTLAEEAAGLQKQLRRKVSRGKLAFNLTVVLVLIAVLAAASGSWLWTWKQSRDLQQSAAQALQAGKFEEAIQGYRILLDSNVDNRGYRSNLVRALFMQSRAAEEGGDSPRSRAALIQAIDLCIGRPQMQQAAAAILLDWAKDLETKAQPGEARVRLERAARLDEQNPEIQASLRRLASDTELYWKVYQVAEGPMGSHPVENYKDMGAVAAGVRELVARGMVPYESRMMVALADLTGEGVKDLLVAGTHGEGSRAEGRYAIYRVQTSRLDPLRTGVVRKTPVLVDLQAWDLSGTKRFDAVMTWRPLSTEDLFHTMLVAFKGGRFLEEVVPSDLVVDVADRNRDGRAEIWMAELVAESTGPTERVLFHRPFLWNAPGFEKATGDFSQHYRDYKEGLELQIEENPYPPADPRHEKFRQDRLKGLGTAETLLDSH